MSYRKSIFAIAFGLFITSCAQSEFSANPSEKKAVRTKTQKANDAIPNDEVLQDSPEVVVSNPPEATPVPEVVDTGDGDTKSTEPVTKEYTGGCIGVRHGGSAAAANAMNRKYDAKYEASCKLTFDLSKDFGKDAVGKSKIEVSFINGLLPNKGSSYSDGSKEINDSNFACSLATTNDVMFGSKTASISILEKSYTDSDQIIGSHNKGGKWSIEFDPATKILTLSTMVNGWGTCRYNNNCGACIQKGIVKLTTN